METFETEDGEILLDDNKIWVRLDFPLQNTRLVLGITIIVWFVFLFLEGVVKIYIPFVIIFIMILLFAAVFLFYLLRVVVYYLGKKRRLLAEVVQIVSAGILNHGRENFLILNQKDGRMAKINLGEEQDEGESLLEELRKIKPEITELNSE